MAARFMVDQATKDDCASGATQGTVNHGPRPPLQNGPKDPSYASDAAGGHIVPSPPGRHTSADTFMERGIGMRGTSTEDDLDEDEIWGAIDGTHIPILAPRKGYPDFVNMKHWPSFNMQAVVDDRGVFRSISCSAPGSAHHATVLKLSGLYRHSDRLLPTDDCVVNGRPIPLMLVGDPVYQLLPWILKGYVATKNGISQKDDSFNTYLSSARIVVEHAFGRMKGTWRIVLKRADIDYKFVPTMAAAVCVLHNFCELHSDRYNIEWNADVAEYEKIFPQPVSSPRDVDAKYPIRDFLRDHLGDNFPLRSSSYVRQA
ncbi:hypothetical protein HPB47_019404 [Ixodes persulcatus]|uniref:Uncharacterized protein n=1 Tax=Ixodes persulcatus TaxID=34615 RepID=A0AC60QI93_IXOPE|nr:hypothetical protein HPB47_019404 [Ixodes persulcatus]